MIRAYDKIYLEKACVNLGRMFDFAVCQLGYNITDFIDMFMSSGVADDFGNGDFRLISGMSGVELAYEVMEKSGIESTRTPVNYSADRSPEYWTGWALAYYQWFSSLSFSSINKSVPVIHIMDMYNPYHEMDIRQFCDKMTELYKSAHPMTNLKKLRTNASLSQKDLADITGISIRTIQQYEQRQKSINKAGVDQLEKLSNALHCNIIDLTEALDET